LALRDEIPVRADGRQPLCVSKDMAFMTNGNALARNWKMVIRHARAGDRPSHSGAASHTGFAG
jgi:hypothetical protein